MIFDPKPAIIGHRGNGSGTVDGHRENTVESYRAALAHGLPWIEVDLRRTADDGLVVHHDPTTGDGGFIVDRPTSEVTAHGLARFEEVLEVVPPGVGVDVDAKSELEDATCVPDRRTAALIAPVLAREADRRPLFVSSFDPGLLLELRERVPGLALGLLTWVCFPLRHAVPAAAHLGFDAVGLHAASFGPNRVENRPVHRPIEYSVRVAHEAGLEVLAWCPDAADAVRFAGAGADALCVNDIPGVLAALAEPTEPTEPSE